MAEIGSGLTQEDDEKCRKCSRYKCSFAAAYGAADVKEEEAAYNWHLEFFPKGAFYN